MATLDGPRPIPVAGDRPTEIRPAVFPPLPRFTWTDPATPRDPQTFEICVVITAGHAEFVARDVLAALDHDLGVYAADPSHEADQPYQAHGRAATWSLELTRDILKPIDTAPRVAKLLTWLADRMADLDELGAARIEDTNSPIARKQPASYSVAAAARLLSRDPAIDIGQQRLFEHLHTAGWITREGRAWQPAPASIELGLLDLQLVNERHYSRSEPYPQVLITVHGLRTLHERLGGIADLALAAPNHLTLVDEGTHQ
ncbi:phage antirepressor KilAC domain-containing protein [Agromyces sp. SYSU T00194]|uniref:phage antirepressor KilAC domain-containing protein n=1 Tax=Agromyces chitinivorans TaxID=3158560 RepID=UPI003397214C